jgi:predicted TIM-barrel fold metal-dependent hydrolase
MPWNRAACLTALSDMCARFPHATVVVDHFSNLSGAKDGPDFGVDGLLDALARFPRVIQKFTMINITKMNQQGVPCAPVVKRVAQSYGANRIMWGSDVAQSKGSYADMVRLGLEATSLLAEEDRQQVHYRTARSVYAW